MHVERMVRTAPCQNALSRGQGGSLWATVVSTACMVMLCGQVHTRACE